MNGEISVANRGFLAIARHGIHLDSRSASLRSQTMTGTAEQGFSPRRRDRRIGLADVLSALSRSIGERADAAMMRGTFEEILRRAVPVRAVHLREINSRWAGATTASETIES